MNFKAIAAVSLMINIFILGLFMGNLISHNGFLNREGEELQQSVASARQMHGTIAPVVMALPRTDRDLVRRHIAPDEKIASRREEAAITLDQIVQSISTPEFDEAAFLEALSRTRKASQDRALDVEISVAKRVGSMSLKQRQDMAKRLKGSIKREMVKSGPSPKR
jgi:uncharacterized membrane protein